jgi:hypothetical protein
MFVCTASLRKIFARGNLLERAAFTTRRRCGGPTAMSVIVADSTDHERQAAR